MCREQLEEEIKRTTYWWKRATEAENALNELLEKIKSCPRHPHWSGTIFNCSFCNRGV